MPGIPSLNDVLTTLNRMKVLVERLRRRQSGVIEAEASSFPHRVNLSNFRAADEIAVVASGWCDDGRVRSVTIHTAIHREGDAQVLAITPHGADGDRMTGSIVVHVAWIAMA